MSRKAAIGALALALVLCVAAYFLLADRGGGTPVRPLFSFLPSEATSLVVRHPDQRTESAVRGGAGDWTIQVARPGADAPATWPADPAPVRAILRLLSTLTPLREAERATTLDPAAAQVEIGLQSGRLTFTLGAQAIGGRALLRLDDPVGPRTVWIDAGLAQALVNTGLLPWRDKSLLAGFTRDVSRIRLTSAGGTLALGKVTGHWGLREPVAAPADERSVQRLIATLAGLEITSFLDSRTDSSASLAPPLATLVLESDQREPRAQGEGFLTRTHRWTVEFREGGGLAAAQLLARVERREEVAEPGKQPTVALARAYQVSVPADKLADLAAGADAYIARTPCRTPAADIGGLAITRPGAPARVFSRTLDGWNEDKDGTPVPCPPEDSRSVTAIAAWLCDTPAATVTTTTPADWQPAATVELRTLGGAPLVSIEIGGGAAAGAPVVTRVGPVWRSYPADAAPAAAWILGAP